MKNLFQFAGTNDVGEKTVTYKLSGKGTEKAFRLKLDTRREIIACLEDETIESVYRRGKNYYKLAKDGTESRILRGDNKYKW